MSLAGLLDLLPLPRRQPATPIDLDAADVHVEFDAAVLSTEVGGIVAASLALSASEESVR